MCTGLWWGKLKKRDYFGDLGVNGTVLLKLILRNVVGVDRISLAEDKDKWWTCEHSNTPVGSINCSRYFD